MRLKYADLAKRHDDVLAKYMGIQEENKILRKLQNTPSNEVSSQVTTGNRPKLKIYGLKLYMN